MTSPLCYTFDKEVFCNQDRPPHFRPNITAIFYADLVFLLQEFYHAALSVDVADAARSVQIVFILFNSIQPILQTVCDRWCVDFFLFI